MVDGIITKRWFVFYHTMALAGCYIDYDKALEAADSITKISPHNPNPAIILYGELYEARRSND